MTLGRREFLQRLGVALTALGIGDAAFTGLCETYQQALARSSRRLALLVGINQYPDSIWQAGSPSDKGAPLRGAVMDVELQRELLIHRFGVAPTDIVTLVDHQATQQSILEAIQGHLVDQAQPGDRVVFHFSGLGSQVPVSGRLEADYLPTLVTADGELPDTANPVIHDLFEETLAQALGNLQGVQVMTVLDASSTAAWESPIQGNFRVRSRPTVPAGEWRAETDILFKAPRKTTEKLSATWPGLLWRASRPGMPALEGNWDGFSAGVFTYALTQQIWSSFPAQRQQWIFHHAERTMETWTGAKVSPQLRGQASIKGKDDLLAVGDVPQPAANGIVKTIDTASKTATLWLGGLPASLLPYCNLGLRLKPLPALPGLAAVPSGTVSVKTVEGLRAKATLLDTNSLPAGTPLIEIERRLPREVSLTVALDPDLERIERVDATSALAALPYITTTAPGEQQADCLFGRLKTTDPIGQVAGASVRPQNEVEIAEADPPPTQSGYGLFSPNHTLIPGTLTEEDEAVKTAVGRLNTPLKNLLAVKVLRLTANPASSQLPLRLILETREASSKLLAVEETLRSRQISGANSAPREKLGLNAYIRGRNQKFRLQLTNLGQQPLYYLIVSVVDKNLLSVYCPPLETTSSAEQPPQIPAADVSQLLPGETLRFPRLEDNSLSFQQLQSAEIFAIACTQPFYETWKAIQTPEFRQLSDRLASIPDPLPLTTAILSDLDRASQQTTTSSSPSQESVVSLSSNVWATLSLQSPIEPT